MTLPLRTYLFIVGGLLAAGGFIALALPVAVPETTEFSIALTCGNGFAMDENEVRGYRTIPIVCEEAIGERRAWAWPLLVGGLVITVGGFVVRSKPEQPAAGPASV